MQENSDKEGRKTQTEIPKIRDLFGQWNPIFQSKFFCPGKKKRWIEVALKKCAFRCKILDINIFLGSGCGGDVSICVTLSFYFDNYSDPKWQMRKSWKRSWTVKLVCILSIHFFISIFGREDIMILSVISPLVQNKLSFDCSLRLGVFLWLWKSLLNFHNMNTLVEIIIYSVRKIWWGAVRHIVR